MKSQRGVIKLAFAGCGVQTGSINGSVITNMINHDKVIERLFTKLKVKINDYIVKIRRRKKLDIGITLSPWYREK